MKKDNNCNVTRPKLTGRNPTPEERAARDEKERAEIAETGLLFNLKDFKAAFNGGILSHYFLKIHDASIPDLKRFKRNIRRYKNILNERAFSDSSFKKYDILKAAINHEILKRRPFYYQAYCCCLPIRRQIAWWTGHRKMLYREEFGVLFQYEYSNNFFYVPISKHLSALKRFWLSHWKWILSRAGGAGFVFWVIEKFFKRQL